MAHAKLAFLVAFFIVLLLPLADTIHPFIKEPVLRENRLPAKAVDFAMVFHGDGKLSGDLGRWFDDRMRPRSLLIGLKNQLDYWLFRHSDKIYIGHESWLFERTFFDAAVARERAGDARLELAQQRFVTLARYLARRGIRLIVIADPVKATVYSRFLPSDVPQLPADPTFQKMRRFLKSRRELIYIDGEDVLTNHCPDVVVFHHIDIHPTFPGGLCLARELTDRVAAAEGRSQSPWDHHFGLSTVNSDVGGEADFMALLYPIFQDAYVVEGLFERGKSTGEGDFTSDPHGLFEWVFHTREPYRASKLPTLVMVGKSFVDHYANAGFYTYFADVYRMRDPGTKMPVLLRNLPPDTRYLVYEFIEPFMYDMPSLAAFNE